MRGQGVDRGHEASLIQEEGGGGGGREGRRGRERGRRKKQHKDMPLSSVTEEHFNIFFGDV